MSADNYNLIDYDPDHGDHPWSVTQGFDSDEEEPKPNRNTEWFATAFDAIVFGEYDWTEYGTRTSARAIEQMKKEGRARAAE